MTILENSETASRSGKRAIDTLAVGAVALMAFAWHAMLPLNHDVAWIWEGAGRLADGARFGDGVVDVNPPLAWWIMTVPAIFAHATHLSPSIAFAAFMALLGGLSILLSLRTWNGAQLSRWGFALSASWALLVMPGYDFGQREHLMMVLALPWLGVVVARAQDETPSCSLSWSAGILAGLGFSLKPCFFFVPFAVEIWLGLRRHKVDVFRIENLALALTAMAYLLAVVILAPDYLHRVVPDAVAGYGAYAGPLWDTVFGLGIRMIPVLIGCGCLVLADPARRFPVAAQAFLAASLGAALACLVQSKDWSYQMLPALGFAAIAAGVSVSPAGKRGLAAMGVAIVLALTSLPALSQWMDGDGTRARVASLSAVFAETPGEKVFAFITSPRDIHPAIVESGASWIAPACCLYLLPAAVEKTSPAAVAAGERQARQTVDLLIRQKPDVVAVDDNARRLGFGTRRFDYLAYFARDARFERFWTRYREGQRIGGFQIFRCTEGCSGNAPQT